MSTEQARWEALIERELFGETLDEGERGFVRAYEAAHPECALEREVWDAARERLALPGDDPETLARLTERALAAHRSQASEAVGSSSEVAPLVRPRRTRRVAALAGAVALASAAALALWLGVRGGVEDEGRVGEASELGEPPSPDSPPPPRTPANEPAPVDPTAYLSMAIIDAPLARALGPGASAAESGCLSWTDPTAVVCFEGHVELEPEPARGERALRLREGRLVAALDPLAPGQRFDVETLLGSVSAIGTVFAVEIHDGRIWVTVLEGRVELRDAELRTLDAGQRASLRGEIPGEEPGPTQHTPTALEQLAELATLLRASPGRAKLELDLPSELRVELDGHPLGAEVHALLLAPGEHRLELLDPAGELLAERSLSLSETQPVALSRALAEELAAWVGVNADTHEADASRRPVPSAKQLAQAAQSERAAGHHAETARLYRALLEHYPDSPEAVNVPVRLGDLLASTGDHEGALAAYELYLERGARQLAPEAEYGRILALRALGRRAEEAEAIAAFVAAYPDDYRAIELAGKP